MIWFYSDVIKSYTKYLIVLIVGIKELNKGNEYAVLQLEWNF